MRQTDRFSFRVCDRSAVSGASQTPLLRPQRRLQSRRTRAFTNHSAKHAKQIAHRLCITNHHKKICLACGNFCHVSQTHHGRLPILRFKCHSRIPIFTRQRVHQDFLLELMLPKFIGCIETINFTRAEARPTRHAKAKLISWPSSS